MVPTMMESLDNLTMGLDDETHEALRSLVATRQLVDDDNFFGKMFMLWSSSQSRDS